jgi:hypothetical protein
VVILFKAVELVPDIGHRVDLGSIRAIQVITELQVIRRVGKDQIHRGFGQAGEQVNTVAEEDLI